MASDSSNTSCRDLKLELTEQRRLQFLLNWLNQCVHPTTPVTKLNKRSLLDVLHKYKLDICDDEILQSILDSADVEQFIRYKYPLLILKNVYDEEDNDKKLYIMTAVLMYHCYINSVDGKVDSDIYAHLNRSDQEMILKYCEGLMDMEVTVNNVESAIRDACDAMKPEKCKTKAKVKMLPDRSFIIDSGESCQPVDPATKLSVSRSLLRLSISSISEVSKRKNIRFDNSLTDLPSALTKTSSYTNNKNVINYDSMVPKQFISDNTQSSLEGTRVINFMAKSTCEFRSVCLPKCACPECHPAERGRPAGPTDAQKYVYHGGPTDAEYGYRVGPTDAEYGHPAGPTDAKYGHPADPTRLNPGRKTDRIDKRSDKKMSRNSWKS